MRPGVYFNPAMTWRASTATNAGLFEAGVFGHTFAADGAYEHAVLAEYGDAVVARVGHVQPSDVMVCSSDTDA